MPADQDGSAYFIYHSIGQYHGKARDMAGGLAEFAAHWGRADDAQWHYALGVRARYIERWRTLIGAPEGTVTATENVTAGVHALITSLPLRRLRGKRVLVAQDCFPSVHFLLSGLQEKFGFTLDTVPLRQGASWAEDADIVAHWTPDVAVALLTWISSTSSHRSDLPALIAHGRRIGSLIGVDITQGAGLLPFGVMSPAVDFTVSTSLKWMCGSPGAGMLHVAEDLIGQCAPELRGWFSQPDPFNWDITRFRYAPDVRRFDHGTPAIMACAATVPALDWHAAQDHAKALAHNRRLCSLIQDGIRELNLTLVSPRSPEERGGSIMVALPAGRPAKSVLEQFRSQAIYADARGQTLRLSPGVLTRQEGVGRMLHALKTALA